MEGPSLLLPLALLSSVDRALLLFALPFSLTPAPSTLDAPSAVELPRTFMPSSELTRSLPKGSSGTLAPSILAVEITLLEPLYDTSLMGARVGLTLTLLLFLMAAIALVALRGMGGKMDDE